MSRDHIKFIYFSEKKRLIYFFFANLSKSLLNKKRFKKVANVSVYF